MIESNSMGKRFSLNRCQRSGSDQLFDSLLNPLHIMENRTGDFPGDKAFLTVIGPVRKGSLLRS